MTQTLQIYQPSLPTLIPFVRYADPEAAIAWLTSILGFQRHFSHTEQGVIVHAELRLGQNVIMASALREDNLGLSSPDRLGGSNQGIYVAVNGEEVVEATFQQVQDSGARIVQPVTRMDYGSLEFTCRDPGGNLWSVGSYVPAPNAHEGA